MNPVEIIRKKRDGEILTAKEIQYFVTGFTNGGIPDYQVSAFAMAVYFMGFNDDELYQFTKQMIETGDIINHGANLVNYVDKHSTGGVGDKLTLVVAPIVAACGLKIPKMSGRGLSFSGGTIDKLESIKGFKVDISRSDFLKQIDEIGLGIIGQSDNIAKSDKQLYGIRDVTATVESIPLIASSIVSKKIASGSKNIIFDVKVGIGAFMKDIKSGIALARTLVDLVKDFGGKSVAVVSNMNNPLGHYVGNSLEIMEVVECLKGNLPKDIEELVYELSGQLLIIGGKANNIIDAKKMVIDKINSGEALIKFKELIEHQGGDSSFFSDYSKLPQSKYKIEVKSEFEGFISFINAEKIGLLSINIGAGRITKKDIIDYSAGTYIPLKINDQVSKGDIIGIIYHSKPDLDIKQVVREYKSAFSFKENPGEDTSMIFSVIS
ncbi:MAG: pyrimidine-nucleoside phosphorylase [Fusobacteria bacterium]|nr:MAG: pyrimidine-nucleoside phosphorylase [Fusobacteriota bacterium]KAF0229873.1 MAG: pyrimidine-nucleoside [Fusobacteriota bacterium]